MARAEKQIEVDKVEEKKNVSAGGMPAWLLIIMLLMVVAFSITMMLLPREYVVFTGGVVLIGVTILYDLAVWGYIVLRAFYEEGIGSAILNFFFPIVFVVTHWDECAFMWIVARYNGFLITGGLAMIGASNLFNDAENQGEDESFLRSTNSRVVVEAASDPSLVEILRLARRLDSRA